MTPLVREIFGVSFANPVLLAAGTCGFGRELSEVLDLDVLGGFVTKSVTLEPRWGNPAPRVSEFPGGMLNSIGLANPGVEVVRKEKLPWIRERVRRAKVFVSVAGHSPEEFEEIVLRLDGEAGFVGYELNLSCPNDARRSSLPFALDPEALVEVLGRVRERTDRPLVAKLAPNTPDFPRMAGLAHQSGADGITVVNTIPGYLSRPEGGASALGAGSGGVSGPLLRPVGVHAVRSVVASVPLPVVGVGGVSRPEHVLEYLAAGASLVQVGTATFADPRAALRVIRGLDRIGGLPERDVPTAVFPEVAMNQEKGVDG